jgi:hypothetical protein
MLHPTGSERDDHGTPVPDPLLQVCTNPVMHFLLHGFAPIIETSQSPPTLTSRSENSGGIVSSNERSDEGRTEKCGEK